MKRFLYDTNVFLYALGGEHPYQQPCSEIVRLASGGVLRGDASIDLVQEFLHGRARQLRDRKQAAQAARDVAALCKLHPLRPEDLARALDLYERHPRLDAVDAVFAATAINRGIELILSADRDFDGIERLTRIDPLDGEAVAALGG
jgi:predicted nucleic acid-binding protein